jgi:hypothetical protein
MWSQGRNRPITERRHDVAADGDLVSLRLTPDELAQLLDEPRLDEPHMPTLPTSDSNGDETAPANAAYVEAVRNDIRRLVELDTRYGGDDLVHLAVRATKAADEHLAAGTRSQALESDLQAAVGELAQVAAWIAYDADQQALARRLTNEALLHSRLTGDRRMELFELAQLAMQSIHLKRPGEALRIANQVIESARTGPRVAAVFHLRRARALATIVTRGEQPGGGTSEGRDV